MKQPNLAVVKARRYRSAKPVSLPKVGKPTTYDPVETPIRARKYVDTCIAEDRTPFLEELAMILGVSDKTLNLWAYPEDKSVSSFAEIYEILLTVQKLDIKKKSLAGVYVSVMGKLILSAEHNVVEKVKKEVSGENGEPIKFEQSLSPEQFKEYSSSITKIFEKMYSKI